MTSSPPASNGALTRQRVATMHGLGRAVSNAARGLNWMAIEIPAHRVFLRFVKLDSSSYLREYGDVFAVPPDGRNLGAHSLDNRFTGLLPDGQPGLNGSYWGTADGAAAEDHYYAVWKEYDGSGPKRLMATHGHQIVQRTLGKLKYGMDGDVPQQLLFSGSAASNVIVARTIRPLTALNLDVSNPRVQLFLKRMQPVFQPYLDALRYPDMLSAIEDREFRDFARCLAHGACSVMKPEAIWVRSVRAADAALHGLNKDAAHNLVLLGDARATLTDRLVGCGVIQIRSDSGHGVVVTAAPLFGADSPYADRTPKSLMVIPQPG